eukprot:CAMPEP_0169427548 /NCGR_PEP_ID=MMETSP1042-20121227/835_1 /TAXON_ID=464988 /ORGANISM="Hemiselmis andersenii, Strain CCMP1180" /LENGTH=660 /DNA_ID=CAMNT_0009537625 /DNA_START=22 /DNA_END=2005 /DNA_ORIENTATION=-
MHPLDELSADEITQAAELVRKKLGGESGKLRFQVITLAEPTKAELAAFASDGSAPLRAAECLVLLVDKQEVSEIVLDLATGAVVREKIIPSGTQPLFSPDDCFLAERIVQEDPEVKRLLSDRYGISDMSQVACDPWSVHLADDSDRSYAKWKEGAPQGRLIQTFLYWRKDGGMACNHYAHPIDLLPVVDLNAEKVIRIDGSERMPPPKIPSEPVNYHRDLVKNNTYLPSKFRDAPAALNVTQPDGPSFVVDGNVVKWQGWDFRVGFNYREGLVIHDASFQGKMVLRRGSLVEMAVPYADPHPPFQRKCAFDVGDYGLGYCANSLELGCDCLGHIHYFDGTLSDSAGKPYTVKKAICMHEEDQGLLWKHVEYRNAHNESRRSRELVVSFIATVVNYEYLFYWRFKQDGTIDYEIKLSGELSTNLMSAAEDVPSHGVIVAPGVNSQYHQHMFCTRLDVEVAGASNTVSEIDIITEPMSPSNPYGNCFKPQETTLRTEKEGIRTGDPMKARHWKISNPSILNSISGKPVAYKLIPFTRGPAQPPLLVSPDCAVAKKGMFATKHLWVTPYSPSERYPAGEFTPQGDGSNGLPAWTAQDRQLDGQDVVLWHCFGVAHIPRVEDFPVMPCEVTGFTLKPDGFSLGNPGIDIPPDANKASKCCSHGV